MFDADAAPVDAEAGAEVVAGSVAGAGSAFALDALKSAADEVASPGAADAALDGSELGGDAGSADVVVAAEVPEVVESADPVEPSPAGTVAVAVVVAPPSDGGGDVAGGALPDPDVDVGSFSDTDVDVVDAVVGPLPDRGVDVVVPPPPDTGGDVAGGALPDKGVEAPPPPDGGVVVGALP